MLRKQVLQLINGKDICDLIIMYPHYNAAQSHAVDMETIPFNLTELFEQLRSFINVPSSDCGDL